MKQQMNADASRYGMKKTGRKASFIRVHLPGRCYYARQCAYSRGCLFGHLLCDQVLGAPIICVNQRLSAAQSRKAVLLRGVS
jgi:hypothetical protein